METQTNIYTEKTNNNYPSDSKISTYDQHFIDQSKMELKSYQNKLAGSHEFPKETNSSRIRMINEDVERIEYIISRYEQLFAERLNPKLKLIQLREELEDALSQIDNEEKRLDINIANGATADLEYITNQSNTIAEIAQKIKNIELN